MKEFSFQSLYRLSVAFNDIFRLAVVVLWGGKEMEQERLNVSREFTMQRLP